MNVRIVKVHAAGMALAFAAAVYVGSVGSYCFADDAATGGKAKPEKPPKIHLQYGKCKAA